MHMTINIDNLRLRCMIGVYQFEHERRQELLLSANITFDGGQAAAEDKLEHTIDYLALSEQLRDELEATHYNLVEKLLAQSLDIIFANPHVLHAHVEIEKPAALRAIAETVSVSAERMREDESA